MNTAENQSIGELMEPNRIGFSFGAPGWTILLIICLLAILGYALWKLYMYKKNKYRRLAIRELESINITRDEPANTITNIVIMLKRVALTAYGREDVASINGVAFVRFLQDKTSSETFSADSESMFKSHLYEGRNARVSSEQLECFYNESINWIKQHHV